MNDQYYTDDGKMHSLPQIYNEAQTHLPSSELSLRKMTDDKTPSYSLKLTKA